MRTVKEKNTNPSIAISTKLLDMRSHLKGLWSLSNSPLKNDGTGKLQQFLMTFAYTMYLYLKRPAKVLICHTI